MVMSKFQLLIVSLYYLYMSVSTLSLCLNKLVRKSIYVRNSFSFIVTFRSFSFNNVSCPIEV